MEKKIYVLKGKEIEASTLEEAKEILAKQEGTIPFTQMITEVRKKLKESQDKAIKYIANNIVEKEVHTIKEESFGKRYLIAKTLKVQVRKEENSYAGTTITKVDYVTDRGNGNPSGDTLYLGIGTGRRYGRDWLFHEDNTSKRTECHIIFGLKYGDTKHIINVTSKGDYQEALENWEKYDNEIMESAKMLVKDINTTAEEVVRAIRSKGNNQELINGLEKLLTLYKKQVEIE